MVFNSLEFFVFAVVLFVIYGFIYHRNRSRDIILLAASYLFYSAWYYEYSLIILASTCVDYVVGRNIYRANNIKKKRLLLLVSLVFNLGVLGVFKYFNYFSEVASSTAGLFGFTGLFVTHELLLPIGISFYTFQTLSYTIDIYKGKLNPEPEFIKFALFVSFFPQLVAGPIVRATTFLPQLSKRLTIDDLKINAGLFLIFCGLFKKVIIADSLAFMAVDKVFDNPELFNSIDLLMALYGYSFQIYCDFSGYSDIAIGLAIILGFRLPKNFDRPYISQNISEFWRRWHISLSSWLRDYLYISLGGNRLNPFRTKVNLMITMLLGGLWHGASTNFILWGLYHGLLLMLYSYFKSNNGDEVKTRTSVWINTIFTFHLVVFSWLLFRINNMADLSTYLVGLLSFSVDGTQLGFLYYVILLTAFILHYMPERFSRDRLESVFLSSHILVKAGVYAGAAVLFFGLAISTPNFLYFQF